MQCTHIFFLRINRNSELPGKGADKFSVTVGIRSTQAVIQVGNCRSEEIFHRQVKQNMGKGNRIRASGDGHKNRISPAEHPVV